MIIPKQVDFTLKSEIFNNFRCKMACDSLDIDIKKKSVHHLKIENIAIPDTWNIGVIYGASGSGKTTLAKHLFGSDCFKTIMNEEEPVINQFPKEFTYDECASILNGIGLTSVVCWVRPIKTLSNGQRARSEAALLMTKNSDLNVIDEWTSVVDRTVAKVMSHCVQKFARKQNKQIILLSCHHDIIEWVKPDWLIDCNKQQFFLPQSEDFFFQPRERLEFTIREVGRQTWKYFSKYHYLSENLPSGKIYTFGLFHGENQIGFQCFANYVPIRKGMKPIFHFNRIVVHPDYAGMGLGIKVINITSQYLKDKYDYKIMGKFSSVPVFKAMIKDRAWKFLGERRVFGKMKIGGTIDRRGGFRDQGIKTYHFEFNGF
jgi:ABC-type Mn2+/Zn2+ transport system ATPase subunit